MNHKLTPTVLSWGPESELLNCISMDKYNKATRLTPSEGLRMFGFRCLGFRRKIGCMQEIRFTGVKTRMESLTL